jgi:dCTP deaminase
MILPASEIAQRLRAGIDGRPDSLVITPGPDPAVLERTGAASVDLRLGTWFVSPRPRSTPYLDVFEETSPEHSEEWLTKTSYIPFGRRYFLHPRNFVLAATLEWVRMPSDLAGSVVGKSSWGRRGLIIATATGVHPSFSGCLTLELANVGELPIAIYPGLQIGQLFLQRLTQGTAESDQSDFVGFGRPVLGRLKIDDVARRLRGG